MSISLENAVEYIEVLHQDWLDEDDPELRDEGQSLAMFIYNSTPNISECVRDPGKWLR